MIGIVHSMAETPGVCILLSVFFFLISWFMLYSLADALLKMHRSKSAVRKIKKGYTFRQLFWMVPHERACIHALKFCTALVYFWRVRCIVFALYLLLGAAALFGLPVSTIIAWCTAGIFVLFDVPMFIVNFSLMRPIIGRFREFSFEKYHHTKDFTSIF
ncbi:MAG: hypothetical protein IJY28_04755 [Clostridia bacterium]|nr:hypothetical protein [Clostridia bacterium]